MKNAKKKSRDSILKCVLGLSAMLCLGRSELIAAIELRSPDGCLMVTTGVKTLGNEPDCPYYRVTYKGRTVLAESRLGLDLQGNILRSHISMTETSRSRQDSSWKPVCGERSMIRDCYHQMVVECSEEQSPHRRVLLTFRAYNEGIAFCYTLPRQPAMENVRIQQELTEFCFDGDYTAWATYAGQGEYHTVPLSQIKPGCERPLVVRVAEDLYAAVVEARLVDYARMKLKGIQTSPHALQCQLDGAVESSLPLTTPWRVIMAANSPGKLLDNNFIILNLNEPCAIEDSSWIKPGKVIREVTLTTAGGKACVDFAVERGLQYIEYDAGWYGYEFDPKSDASAVHLDPKRSKGPLDLQEVICYADQRDIGVLLYVNHLALEKQLDELLPLYRQWGVKGIKFGFVNVGSQKWTSWLHEAIRKCADYQIMVDVHDEYRTTGYGRTYPNLMTVEGVRGDETSPDNAQTLTYLFTRMLAGYADHTVCYYDKRVDQNASHAYQLAKAVCFFSPWQFLFWYDRPSAAPAQGDGGVPSRERIGEEPELEFWKQMPTVWDESRVLKGVIAEYAVIARRSGDRWYIGCMNADSPRTIELPLDFLEPEQVYTALIYSDDPAVQTRTHVKKEQMEVRQNSVLKVILPARGGQAIRIVPGAKANP
ncbi:MAG: glycoside hydrolase family 97 N-terminal domain-containing protein [Anaerohalosphaeraceae bacterium]